MEQVISKNILGHNLAFVSTDNIVQNILKRIKKPDKVRQELCYLFFPIFERQCQKFISAGKTGGTGKAASRFL